MGWLLLLLLLLLGQIPPSVINNELVQLHLLLGRSGLKHGINVLDAFGHVMVGERRTRWRLLGHSFGLLFLLLSRRVVSYESRGRVSIRVCGCTARVCVKTHDPLSATLGLALTTAPHELERVVAGHAGLVAIGTGRLGFVALDFGALTAVTASSTATNHFSVGVRFARHCMLRVVTRRKMVIVGFLFVLCTRRNG